MASVCATARATPFSTPFSMTPACQHGPVHGKSAYAGTVTSADKRPLNRASQCFPSEITPDIWSSHVEPTNIEYTAVQPRVQVTARVTRQQGRSGRSSGRAAFGFTTGEQSEPWRAVKGTPIPANAFGRESGRVQGQSFCGDRQAGPLRLVRAQERCAQRSCFTLWRNRSQQH
jgi:hypothetical protein